MSFDSDRIREQEAEFLSYVTENLMAFTKQARTRKLVFLAYLIEIAAHESASNNKNENAN